MPVEAPTTETVTVPDSSVLPKPTQETKAGARRYHTASRPGAVMLMPATGGETTVMRGEEENSVEEFNEVIRME